MGYFTHPPCPVFPREDLGTMRRTFPGFSDTFLPSLVLAVSELTHESSGCLKRQHPEIEKGVSDGDDIENETTLEDELYNECKESLLRVATPEAMCRFGRCRGGVGGAAGGELEYAAGEKKVFASETFGMDILDILPTIFLMYEGDSPTLQHC